MLAPQLQKTPFAAPALPPFAHCRSCPQYPADDVPSHNHFRPHRSTLNAARLVELREVNRDVNRSICSDANTKTLRALCAVSEDGRLQRLCCDQAEIKLWTEAPYRSVRIKTPAMPTFWATVGKAQAQEGSGVSWSGASRNATPADICARLKRTGADCVSLQSLPLGSATTGVAKPPRPDRSRFLQPPNMYWMCSGPLVVTAATESPWPKQ
jgi:hypothetical protein